MTLPRVVTARAPGKIILTGEYAVMQGAPAVVLGVDRYARVTVTRSGGLPGGTAAAGGVPRGGAPVGTVTAPDLGIDSVAFSLTDYGAVQWHCAPTIAERLGLVAAVLAEMTSAVVDAAGASTDPDAGSRLHLHLDTSEFFSAAGARGTVDDQGAPEGTPENAPQDTPQGRPRGGGTSRGKLGLGSSSALTVTLAAALAAATGRPAPDLARLVALHRAAQGGRGSGFDIAAARHGGALIYRDDPQRGPTAQPVAWPAGLHWAAVFSGRSGATAPLLAQVAAWQQRHPAEAADLRARMAATAAEAATAVTAPRSRTAVGSGASTRAQPRPRTTARPGENTVIPFCRAIEDYRDLMAELGRRSGVDIVGTDHTSLANLADRSGVLYKACGAGGGDLGVALATDRTRLRRFTAEAGNMGYDVERLDLAPIGLDVRSE